MLFQKGFDNIYLLTGGIEEFYQKHPGLVVGTELPQLKADLGTAGSPDKLKEQDKKPKIRKTKEELIMENEMQYLMKKKAAPASLRTGSQGFNRTGNPSEAKPFSQKIQLDPKKILTNKNFDEIPDGPKDSPPKPPSKPKFIRAPLKKETKEVKEITDKLTNIRVDAKTNTSENIERRIERVHNEKKEVTQKPNFGKFTTTNNYSTSPNF